jgi:hypothetical protein
VVQFLLQALFWLKGVCKRVLARVDANDDIVYTMADIRAQPLYPSSLAGVHRHVLLSGTSLACPLSLPSWRLV